MTVFIQKFDHIIMVIFRKINGDAVIENLVRLSKDILLPSRASDDLVEKFYHFILQEQVFLRNLLCFFV